MENDFIMEISSGKINYNTKHGGEIYRRSLTILLECALSELYPDLEIQIGQTIMNGYYYEIISNKKVNPEFIKNINEKLHYLVNLDEKFRKINVDIKQAIQIYKKKGRYDKVKTLSFLPYKKIDLIFLREYFDFVLGECVTSTKYLRFFHVIKYNNNSFILQFPPYGNIYELPSTTNRQPELFKVYLEAREWNNILNIHNVGDLNETIKNNNISTIIKVQEAFHEKKIGLIADKIKSFYPVKKIIFVSGPSSSGKTTFLKRLGIQIRANGLYPEEISLDNYFFPRDKTPKTPDGDYDYECLEALDIELFNNQIKDLLDNKEIILPKYSFKSGKREKSDKKIKLLNNSIILVEGIHALNPKLSQEIPANIKYKIFVSALTQLCIDNDNRIFTSDTRLMRRIIRDFMFRNYSAKETIKRFPKVREGEDKYIFPYQDNADIFFNSSLIYEQSVIKNFIVKLLRQIHKREQEYFEARRFLNYLDFFLSISSKEVPQTSILREFIGKSGFEY